MHLKSSNGSKPTLSRRLSSIVRQRIAGREAVSIPPQVGAWEHAIRGDDDLARHVDCIHFNPVKHGDLPLVWGGNMRDIAGSFGE
jgi:putative transposase